jgi:nitrate reductase NapD
MNISGAIVYAAPRQFDSVRARLAALPGVEIHTETGDGRFIITVEEIPGVPAADTVMRLHQLEGVLSAAMVYQYCDDKLQGEEAQS